jgi:ankyrin repeat protein
METLFAAPTQKTLKLQKTSRMGDRADKQAAFRPQVSLRTAHSDLLQLRQYEREKKIKALPEYKEESMRLINLTDANGKTALHYASQNGLVDYVQTLLKHQPIPIMTDYKQRKPSELQGADKEI